MDGPRRQHQFPHPPTVCFLAFCHSLTWHIHNSALHIGDNPKFGVKGHSGVNEAALIPNTAQHQPTSKVLRVSSGHSLGSLTETLLGRCR